jgi:hypothetical protein
MRLACVLAGVVSMLLPVSATGQDVRASAVLQTFTFDDAAAVGVADAQLLTLPVELTWTLPHAWVRVEGAYADGIVTFPGGGSATVGGVTDTRIVVGSSLSLLSVRALAVLPSGDARYSVGEVSLLGVLASELLPFAVESWGGGGAIGGEAEVTATTGSLALGLTAGYVAARAHAPLESADFSYRPGSQVRLRATVGARVGTASALSLIAGYQRPAREEYADREVYQAGARWEAEVAFAHPFGARESASVHAGLYTRSRGGVTLPGDESGELLPGIVGSSARRLFTLGADLQLARAGLVIVPEGRVRLLSTDDEVGQGWLTTVGVSVDRRLVGGRFGTRLVASPSARVHLGSIDTVLGGPVRFKGWELGLLGRLELGG